MSYEELGNSDLNPMGSIHSIRKVDRDTQDNKDENKKRKKRKKKAPQKQKSKDSVELTGGNKLEQDSPQVLPSAKHRKDPSQKKGSRIDIVIK